MDVGDDRLQGLSYEKGVGVGQKNVFKAEKESGAVVQTKQIASLPPPTHLTPPPRPFFFPPTYFSPMRDSTKAERRVRHYVGFFEN